MGKLKTLPWNPADHIETAEDMAMSLSVALEYDDPGLLLATLSDIARAKERMDGDSRGALHAEINSIESLPDGKTDIATVLTLVRELGLQLRAEVAANHEP